MGIQPLVGALVGVSCWDAASQDPLPVWIFPLSWENRVPRKIKKNQEKKNQEKSRKSSVPNSPCNIPLPGI